LRNIVRQLLFFADCCSEVFLVDLAVFTNKKSCGKSGVVAETLSDFIGAHDNRILNSKFLYRLPNFVDGAGVDRVSNHPEILAGHGSNELVVLGNFGFAGATP